MFFVILDCVSKVYLLPILKKFGLIEHINEVLEYNTVSKCLIKYDSAS